MWQSYPCCVGRVFFLQSCPGMLRAPHVAVMTGCAVTAAHKLTMVAGCNWFLFVACLTALYFNHAKTPVPCCSS